MPALTTGKIRRLQQCAAPGGQLVILAIDHRNNLRRSLNPADPAAVGDETLIEFKRQVVAALGPVASAVLIDAEFGAAPVVESGALPGDTGLIPALLSSKMADPNGFVVERIAQVIQKYVDAFNLKAAVNLNFGPRMSPAPYSGQSTDSHPRR